MLYLHRHINFVLHITLFIKLSFRTVNNACPLTGYLRTIRKARSSAGYLFTISVTPHHFSYLPPITENNLAKSSLYLISGFELITNRVNYLVGTKSRKLSYTLPLGHILVMTSGLKVFLCSRPTKCST